MTATVQKILIGTRNNEFKSTKMGELWELVETSINPIMTYRSERWKMTNEERTQIQTICNGALNGNSSSPTRNPTTIPLTETGFLPFEMIIKK